MAGLRERVHCYERNYFTPHSRDDSLLLTLKKLIEHQMKLQLFLIGLSNTISLKKPFL